MVEPVALATVGWVVSPIISKLVNKACSCLGGEAAQKLKYLETIILPKIRFVIEAAEMTGNVQLEPWLRELKAAAHEAEDFLDGHEYYLLEEKVKRKAEDQVSSLSTSLLPAAKSLRKIGSKAKRILVPIKPKTKLIKSLDRLKKVAAHVDEFVNLLNLRNNIKNNPNLDTSSSAKQHEMTTQRPTASSSSVIYGRDEERDFLINLLVSVGDEPESCSSNWKIPIFAICGMGGAGKTALAQYIFNDRRTINNFDMRMWVQVSREFDASTVTRKMIESASEGECPHIENLDTLQKNLKKILESSWRFLLVLDDVWCDDWNSSEQWEQLLMPLNEIENRGCRILVTTRMKKAASVLGAKELLSLKDLESKDCWSIIKHYAFGDSEVTVAEELVEVGEQIVDKLKSSPLAAKIVGRQLGSHVDLNIWRTVLNGDILKDTVNILFWSFRFLPAHLQRCFAFCSIFPKGYRFISKYLVQFWMAQGFIESSDGNEMSTEDLGRQYLNDLLSYSFFQQHPIYSDSCVIHDLLHDLAEWVSKDDCFRIEGDKQVDIPSTVLHLSITTRNLDVHMCKIGEIRNLRTMIILDGHQVNLDIVISDVVKMFQKLKRLRLLSLRHCRMEEPPSSIGCLKHLRYLDLCYSNVKKLLPSLCVLYHLQVLNLGGCMLESAPKGLSSLITLRHLYTSSGIISLIPDIGRLNSLQTLEEYYVQKKQGYEIAQLKKLSQLRGKLRIMHLENVKDFREAAEAMLKDKTHLQSLTLSWQSPERDAKNDGDLQVLEGLEPPLSLERLRIICYKGVTLPNWVSENRCLHALTIEACTELVEVPRLHHTLRKLVISSCPKLMGLPSLPPNLSELRIASCSELIQVSPFPQNLEVLHISGCPGIETLMSDLSCDEEEGHVLATPLKVLKVTDSTVSQVIFFRCLQNFMFLSVLQINNCQQLTCLCLDRLRVLRCISLYKCQNLTSLEGLELLLHLKRLMVSDCPRLTLFTVLNDGGRGPLPLSLQSLKLHSCGDLSELAMTRFLLGLDFLRYLTICGFSRLHSLDLSHLRALKVLEISKCPELTSVGSLQSLISLHDVKIFDCPKLAAVRGRDRGLSSVKYIRVDELLLLAVIIQDEGLNSLLSLTIMFCPQDIPFSSEQEDIFQHLTSLTSLTFDNCLNLPSFPVNCEKLSSLKQLAVSKCPKIDSLPNLPASLEELRISHCNVKLISSAKKAVLPATKLIID